MEEAILVVAESTESNGTVRKYSSSELVEVGGNGGDISSKTGSNESDPENNNKSKIRIQVSKTKKPLFFYINLAKKYIKQCYDVELSALGMAIPTVITISEILKRNGLATEKKISISTVSNRDDKKGRMIVKAQLEIVLGVGSDKLEESSVALSSI